MKYVKWMLALALLLVVTGCVTQPDPVTGEALIGLDPNTVGRIEGAAEIAIAAGTTAGTIAWPWLLPFVGVAGELLRRWRKEKAAVVKLEPKAVKFHTTAFALVQALEDLKTTNPVLWKKVRTYLYGNKLMTIDVENAIAGLLGKPPVEPPEDA